MLSGVFDLSTFNIVLPLQFPYFPIFICGEGLVLFGFKMLLLIFLVTFLGFDSSFHSSFASIAPSAY